MDVLAKLDPVRMDAGMRAECLKSTNADTQETTVSWGSQTYPD